MTPPGTSLYLAAFAAALLAGALPPWAALGLAAGVAGIVAALAWESQ